MMMKIVASSENVVEQQSELDFEPRARTARVDRQQNLDRLHELRQIVEQLLARAQRFTDEAEVQTFEIAEAAVDHLRRGRGRLRTERTFVEDDDVIVLTRQFPRDSGAVDAAPNNCNSRCHAVAFVAPHAKDGKSHAMVEA